MTRETWPQTRTRTSKRPTTLALALLAALGSVGTTSEVLAQASARFEAAPRAAPRPVTLTDVQFRETGHGQFSLRVQADGPLAFDRAPSNNTRQIQVHFHNARLPQLPPSDAPQLGFVSWSTIQTGSLTLTLDLMNPSAHTSVTQAGNPNTVEIRVRQ